MTHVRAGGHENLSPHQVDARDHLGDGVLHLNPGVHLNEVVLAEFVHQKFHRARVHIAHGGGDLHRVRPQGLPHRLRHAPRGGVLHHLLVAALQGAVPLPQMAHVAVFVRKDLHLDVLGLHQIFFHEDAVVPEGLAGLAFHKLKGGQHVLLPLAQAHAPPAAAGGSLQNHGEAELSRLLQRLRPVPQGGHRAGHGGHAAALGNFLGLQLVAHHAQHVAGRADEGDARLLAGPGEGGVLA